MCYVFYYDYSTSVYNLYYSTSVYNLYYNYLLRRYNTMFINFLM
jgi:hypothetical protein